jgi:hypothetical protein
MAGATTQADRQAQVLAAGYNGPMTDAAINQAYANAATPGDLSSSGLSGYSPQGGSPSSPSAPSMPGNYANLSAASTLLGGIQNSAMQAYNNAKLNLDSDTEAYQKAAQAAATAIAQAGVTGMYNGMPTQQAIKQAADLAQQQAQTMLTYAQQFGMWGAPQPGQLTMAAQQQQFNQAQQAAQLTGWYTPPQAFAPTTQSTWAAVGTPNQATAMGGTSGNMSWDAISNVLKNAPGAVYNEDAAKRAYQAATGADPNNFNGSQNVPISAQDLSNVISAGTNGQFGSWQQLTGGQANQMNAGGGVGGSGYFVGTDGLIHVGSPTGGGQAGWGGGSGTPAAQGWQAGATSSSPYDFLQAPGTQQQQPGYAAQQPGTPPGYGGGQPVQTLAANQQYYQQWLDAQKQALSQWQAQQTASQNYLTMMAGLRGPADWQQYQKVLGATPGGMKDLVAAAAGQYIPGAGATTGVQPQAVSMQSFVNSATGQPQTDNGQAVMNSLVAPNQMAPQTWNALTPSQQQMLLGTWESQGYSKDDAQALFNQSLPKYATQSSGAGSFRLQ